MARIPDESQLGYSVPRTRTPRFQDRSAAIVGEAVEGLARIVGAASNRLQEREDQFNYARAKSALLSADVEARRALEDDPDWETYEKRYTEAMVKARDKAAGMIRGGRDRALFDMDASQFSERAIGEVRNIAKRKEIDWGRAALDEMLDTNRTAALNASDEPSREELIKTTQEAINGALEKGYLNEQEAVSRRQSWSANYAESFIGMQPAEDRIKLLSSPKGTVADMIDPAKRVALLEAAKREGRDLIVRRESQAQEDAIVSRFSGSWARALDEARSIEDPEVRDSTVSRIKVRQAEAKQADIEYRENLSEQALAFINEGGNFADLPIAIKNGLKVSELSSLRSYGEQMAGGGRIRTDLAAYDELSRLAADNPQRFGEMNLLEYRDRLDEGAFEKFADLQRRMRVGGSSDPEVAGFRNINQTVDEYLVKVFRETKAKGEKQEKIIQFRAQFEDRLRAFEAQKGSKATTKDARDILDLMTSKVAIERDFWFDAKKPAHELTIDNVPDADRSEIIAELRKRGMPVTEQSVLDLFIRVNRR